MDTQLLLSPKWWAEHCTSLPEVFSVERQQGEIRQKNSFIQFLLLRLSNGQDLPVVAKLVNLAQNQYRDEEHRARSVQSYRVETSFFQKCAPLLQQKGVRLPAAVYISWEPGEAGLTMILQDLRATPAPGSTVAPGSHGLRQGQFNVLTQQQAEAALTWLANFHAAFWGAPVAVCAEKHGLWCQGGYWTLDKRQRDLHKLTAEWRRTVASFAGSFPQVFQCPSVQALGARLAAAASRLHAQLGGRGLDSTQPTNHGSCQHRPHWTLLHGDFKTANIFLAQAEGQEWTASACDYQWTGGGLGVRDVVYLIWTSVEPSIALQHEQELLHHYWDQLNEGLRQRNAAVYTEEQLQADADVAFLDYTRFLIGSMWGAVSPESCSKMGGDINQGMHKRSSQHLVNMVQKADLLLQAFEQQHPANTSLNTIPGGVNQPFPQASLLPSSTAQRE